MSNFRMSFPALNGEWVLRGEDQADALADLNAARAVLRTLNRL